MGGFGSGRTGGKAKADSCCSLDVNRLQRGGCLVEGWSGNWQWSRGGQPAGSIVIQTHGGHLVLSYRSRSGGEWEDVKETVRLVPIPCRYGGTRMYFECPGVVGGSACARRVAKLYASGGYFLCRHCYRLAYYSQSEDRWDRLMRRANKIRARLGGAPGTATPFPARPKGMWHRTYERLRRRGLEAQMRADEAFVETAQKLLARVHRPKQRKGFWG